MFRGHVARWNMILIALGLCAVDAARAQNPDAPIADPSGFEKCRFISFSIPPAPVGQAPETALRVWYVSLHHPEPPYTGGTTADFTHFEGKWAWVGPAQQYTETNASGVPFKASKLQCAPYYQDWNTVGLLHVTGAAIAPSSIYEVEQVSVDCQGIEDTCAAVSPRLQIGTTRFGDVQIPYNPPSTTTQPDLGDIGAIVHKFSNGFGAASKVRLLAGGDDVWGNISSNTLTFDIGFGPIATIVNAFRGLAYPFKMGRCPGSSVRACLSDADCDGNTGPCIQYQLGKCAGAPVPPNTGDCFYNGDCDDEKDDPENGLGPCIFSCP